MKRLIIVFALCLFFASALEAPYTVEIITARGYFESPVNFFSESSGTFTAILEKSSPVIKLETDSIYVDEDGFGSFNLIIGDGEFAKGVYFDNLVISKYSEIFQEIPVIVGLESRSSEMEYDVSIDFDPNSDVSLISGETIVSPVVNVYKLNYNNPGSNTVALTFSIYSVDGELIASTEEVVSVSRQASFEHFFNLGLTEYDEVLMVVSARKGDSLGLDLSQVSLQSSLLFSLPVDNTTPRLYISIFIFLISSIALISYLWYRRSINEAKDWKTQITTLKKIKFSATAREFRRLVAKKNVLERAYSSKYLSKSSYEEALGEINKLLDKLKKRL